MPKKNVISENPIALYMMNRKAKKTGEYLKGKGMRKAKRFVKRMTEGKYVPYFKKRREDKIANRARNVGAAAALGGVGLGALAYHGLKNAGAAAVKHAPDYVFAGYEPEGDVISEQLDMALSFILSEETEHLAQEIIEQVLAENIAVLIEDRKRTIAQSILGEGEIWNDWGKGALIGGVIGGPPGAVVGGIIQHNLPKKKKARRKK